MRHTVNVTSQFITKIQYWLLQRKKTPVPRQVMSKTILKPVRLEFSIGKNCSSRFSLNHEFLNRYSIVQRQFGFATYCNEDHALFRTYILNRPISWRKWRERHFFNNISKYDRLKGFELVSRQLTNYQLFVIHDIFLTSKRYQESARKVR